MGVVVDQRDVVIWLKQQLGLPKQYVFSRDNRGPDLTAVVDGKMYFFEAIAFSKTSNNRPSGKNQSDFWKAFSQAIARLNENSEWGKTDRVVIALPRQFLTGWQSRIAKQGKSIWIRIGKAFPELEIWFVSEESTERYSWNDAYFANP